MMPPGKLVAREMTNTFSKDGAANLAVDFELSRSRRGLVDAADSEKLVVIDCRSRATFLRSGRYAPRRESNAGEPL